METLSLKWFWHENQIRNILRISEWGEWEKFARDHQKLMKQLRKRKVHLRSQTFLSGTGDACSFPVIKMKYYQYRGARLSRTSSKHPKLLKKLIYKLSEMFIKYTLSAASDARGTLQLYLKSIQSYRITPGNYWPVDVNDSSNQKNKTLGRWR